MSASTINASESADLIMTTLSAARQREHSRPRDRPADGSAVVAEYQSQIGGVWGG